MAGKRKRVTAAELLEELHADSAWVAARAKEEAERQKCQAELNLAEAPLLEELEISGINVRSAWDLVNTSQPYPEALPILLSHLQKSYPAPVREGIARALAVRDAAFGWSVFVKLFKTENDKRVKDGLAVAIANTADDSRLSELIELVRDKSHGPSRKLLIGALEKSKSNSTTALLIELGGDPELSIEVHRIKKSRGRKPRS